MLILYYFHNIRKTVPFLPVICPIGEGTNYMDTFMYDAL